MTECENCHTPFIGINADHIATPWGWFCSDDCIKKYARKQHMTYSDVVQGRKGKAGVRLDNDIYEWLLDHRTSKEKTISDVIRGLIAHKKGSASIERQSSRTPL